MAATAAAAHRTETLEASPRFAKLEFGHLGAPGAKDTFSKHFTETLHAKILALESESGVRTSALQVAVTGVRGGSVVMDTRVHVTLPGGALASQECCPALLRPAAPCCALDRKSVV